MTRALLRHLADLLYFRHHGHGLPTRSSAVTWGLVALVVLLGVVSSRGLLGMAVVFVACAYMPNAPQGSRWQAVTGLSLLWSAEQLVHIATLLALDAGPAADAISVTAVLWTSVAMVPFLGRTILRREAR